MGASCSSCSDDKRSPKIADIDRESRKMVQTKPSKELNKKIVIVGAGPAGIHMASKLFKAGYKNIKILEKTNRICGKSMTIAEANKQGQIRPVHEMGTCFMHPEYFVIEELLKEYDPNNKPIGVESYGVLGTHMCHEMEHKSEMKSIDFQDWALGKMEQLAVPKWLNWVDHKLTGGLSFVIAVKRYTELHRDIFGKQKNNQFYGFPSKPSSLEKLESINCTMLEWLCRHKLQALIPTFVLSHTVQGYGRMDHIPAFYGLFWNTPELLALLIDIRRLVSDKPTVYVLSKGFQSLWTNMVNKHDMDIVLNCNITGVNRHLNDDKKPITIEYQITGNDDGDASLNGNNDNQITQEIECDYLFLACGCKKAVEQFLSDATAQEKEVFLPLKAHTLCSTLYESDFDANWTSECELWPNVTWKANGHLFAQRNDYKVLQTADVYAELVRSGVITRDRSMAYQYLNESPEKDGPVQNEELLEKLQKDLDVWGETNVKILKQTCWDYFPIWNNECIMKGYPWIVKEEMQGKYKNTFYIGSSVCFEAVLFVCEYNNELFDNFIKPKFK